MSNEVKFKATIIRNRFNSEDFKIYVADVNKQIYKDLKGNRNNEYILVGNTPNLIPDVEYDVTAIPEINKKFGIQYKVLTIKRDKPTDYNSSKSFLDEILTKAQSEVLLSVYPNIIDKIVKNDLSDIDLQKTKGIKEPTFNKIKNKVIENFCLIELVEVFGGLIDINVIKKLYSQYTSVSTIKKALKSDPYKCLCKLSRVGFKTADSILLNLEQQNIDNPDKFKFKFDYDLKYSIQRMKSCLNYILEENESSGNTKIGLKEVRQQCGKLVPECISLFVQVIKENSEDIYVDLETKQISSLESYNTEKDIAEFVKDMLKNPIVWNINTEVYREIDDISVTDEQLSTLDMMCNNNIGILTAPAGSGKSASAKALINMLESNKKTYKLMTPTGASSKVLADYTDRKCGTIHRQLEYKPIKGQNPWGYNEENKLDVDIVIIDEFSMTDIFLFKHIIDAIDITKTKILLIFDSFQLPSVACGNVAQDLLSSNVVPKVILTKIFRYSEGGLMQVVTKIRESESFLPVSFKGNHIFGTKKDFVYSELQQEKIPKQLLAIYNKLINDEYSPQDIMVLSAQNKGSYGTKAINKIIQQLMQKDKKNNFLIRGDVKFFKGDKIIQITNNYKAKTPTGSETSIFNGNTGVIINVNYNDMDVQFDDCVITYGKEELNQIELGYCISIHKCLTGDTFLYTNKGIKQIKELDNGAKFGELKNFENNELQVYNGKFMESPSAFYNAGVSDCKKITTKRGYSLTGTLDHKLDVLCEDGYIKPKYCKDIKLGDRLILKTNNEVYGNIIDMPQEYLQPISGDVRMINYKIPQAINKDFSRFIGFMIADGTVCSSGIKFGKNQREVVEEFANTVYKLFGYECKIKHVIAKNMGQLGGMYLTEIGSTFIRDYCKRIDGLQPHNKSVPQFILSATKENQCEFLKGLFEDGSVALRNDNFDHVELVINDELTMSQVRMMLLNMGIISSLNRYNCKSSSMGYNLRLSIYRKHAKIFKELIGFYSYNKIERLNLLNIEPQKASCQESISYIINIIKKLAKDNNIFISNIDRNLTKSYDINVSLLSLNKVIKFFDDNNINNEDVEYLRDINNNSFIDIVETVENKIEQTYCIEMPLTHRFIQNGIQGWNCQGASAKQVIVIAPKAHNFMLNSNLLYVAPTRAKERVYMMGNITTINSAIKKKENLNRDTWLKELLKDN